MKVLDPCQTPILAAEVVELLKSDSRNAFAFAPEDPLESSEIADSDELRRLVTVRRTCGYLADSLQMGRVDRGRLGGTLLALKNFGLSVEAMARLVDCAMLTGAEDPNTALLYLQDLVRPDQVDLVLQELRVLTGQSAIAEDTPRKRKTPTPRK